MDRSDQAARRADRPLPGSAGRAEQRGRARERRPHPEHDLGIADAGVLRTDDDGHQQHRDADQEEPGVELYRVDQYNDDVPQEELDRTWAAVDVASRAEREAKRYLSRLKASEE